GHDASRRAARSAQSRRRGRLQVPISRAGIGPARVLIIENMSATFVGLAAPEDIARYEPVIGLEVHVQLATATKIFCSCPTSFGAQPNTNVCPVCLGLPGALPVLTKKAVDLAIKAALALNCQINPMSRFARKNY